MIWVAAAVLAGGTDDPAQTYGDGLTQFDDDESDDAPSRPTKRKSKGKRSLACDPGLAHDTPLWFHSVTAKHNERQ